MRENIGCGVYRCTFKCEKREKKPKKKKESIFQEHLLGLFYFLYILHNSSYCIVTSQAQKFVPALLWEAKGIMPSAWFPAWHAETSPMDNPSNEEKLLCTCPEAILSSSHREWTLAPLKSWVLAEGEE